MRLKTIKLKQGDLIVLGSRPSMGKTAFALNIAQNVAAKTNKGVLIFSLEMSKENLVKRMLSSETEIELSKITSGELTNENYEKIIIAMDKMTEQYIFIDDKSFVNVSHIKEKILQLYLNKIEAGLIIIDYLQLLEKEETVTMKRKSLEYAVLQEILMRKKQQLNKEKRMLRP